MSERKLEFFAEAINREVEARKRRAKHQLANDLSKSNAKSIEEAAENVNYQIDAAHREATRKSNKKVAAATTQAKAAYFAKQKSHKAQILSEVSEALKNFANSAEYETYLLQQIAAAKARHAFAANSATVKLRPQDMHLAEKIRETTGLHPKSGNPSFIGGFILQSENGKICADYTFKTKLVEVRI